MSRSDSTFLTLLYVSSARRRFTEAELDALLRKARNRNHALAVTGMLAYCDGNFLQVLEGPEAAVRGLYDTISADPRHRDVQVIVEMTVRRRSFPDWAMAYGSCPTATEFEGCVNLLRRGGKGLKGRLTVENPLRPLIVSFIEGNLPGFDPGDDEAEPRPAGFVSAAE